jgi:hypothetical protein
MATFARSATKRAFILDFDNTITTKDTISALFAQVLKYQKLQGRDFTITHADIVSKYTTDYVDHIEKYKPLKENRRSLEGEIDFQRSLKIVETRSFKRVSQSEMFNGISDDVWKRLGQEGVAEGEIEVRRGFWTSGLKQPIESKCCILSVNFSRAFIQGVITVHRDCSFGHFKEIVSNGQTDPTGDDGTVVGPGLNENREIMATSDDKLILMNKIRRKWQAQGENIVDVVYVGDSGTDIECLTDKNVTGVIMTPDGKGSLMDTMSRIGVEVVHIFEFAKRNKVEGVLYWTRDFAEILESPLCI